MFHEIPVPKAKDLRLFGALFCAALIFVSWKFFGFEGVGRYLLYLAPVVLLVGLVVPMALFWVHRGMLYAVMPIGWTISRVILLAILVFVMAPVRLFMVVTGVDKMQRRHDRKKDTYWMDAEHPEDTREDYAKLY